MTESGPSSPLDQLPPASENAAVFVVAGDTQTDTDGIAVGRTNIAPQLRTRVVREARRETWFVVNEGDSDVASLPLPIREGASLRRVEVNGEVAEFSADPESVVIRPRRPLRSGAGTIIVLQFR